MVFAFNISSWEPNEILRDENKPIIDWRRKALSYPLNEFDIDKFCLEDAILIALLISLNENSSFGEGHNSQRIIGSYCPICLLKEATRGSLFVSNANAIENFIV